MMSTTCVTPRACIAWYRARARPLASGVLQLSGWLEVWSMSSPIGWKRAGGSCHTVIVVCQ